MKKSLKGKHDITLCCLKLPALSTAISIAELSKNWWLLRPNPFHREKVWSQSWRARCRCYVEHFSRKSTTNFCKVYKNKSYLRFSKSSQLKLCQLQTNLVSTLGKRQQRRRFLSIFCHRKLKISILSSQSFKAKSFSLTSNLKHSIWI